MLPTTTISDRPRPRAVFYSVERLRILGVEVVIRLAVPAAVLAAGWSLAAFTGTAGAAETEYLTLLATGVLTAVALLTPRPGWETGLGGVLAVLLIWVAPPGPSRGAGLTAVLTALLVLAAIRRWGRGWRPRSLLAGFATVLGFQVLMAAEALLNAGPDPATVGRFLFLPALAAAALAVLVRSVGTGPALIAGAAVATVGGEWGAGPVLALTALAGGAVLADPRPVVGSVAEALGRSPVGGAEGLGIALARASAVIAVVSPLVWQQRAGAVAAAAGLALALSEPGTPPDPRPEQRPAGSGASPRDPRWLRVSLPLLPVLAVWVGAMWMPLHPWHEAIGTALRLPVLLPAVVFAVRGRPVPAIAALGLAVAAGRGAPEPAILAAPAALAALSLPAGLGPRRPAGIATRLQGVWSLVLLAATTLAATYPWLRPEPLATAAAWFGLAPGGAGIAPVLAPLLAMALMALTASLHRLVRAPALVLLAALALLLGAHLPTGSRTGVDPGAQRILDVGNPEVEIPLDGRQVRRVVLDTHLTHAGELLPGVPVAVVRLVDRSGATVEWPLRVGEETGEWAAARPDLARRANLVAPEPWLSQAVETPAGDAVGDAPENGAPGSDTDRRFFARRYRTVLEVDGAGLEPVRLTLGRSRALPPDVTLAVFYLEVRYGDLRRRDGRHLEVRPPEDLP